MTSRPTTRATCADRRAEARGRGPLALRGATLRAPRAGGGKGARPRCSWCLCRCPLTTDMHLRGMGVLAHRSVHFMQNAIGEEWRCSLLYETISSLCAQRIPYMVYAPAWHTVRSFFLYSNHRIYIYVNYTRWKSRACRKVGKVGGEMPRTKRAASRSTRDSRVRKIGTLTI